MIPSSRIVSLLASLVFMVSVTACGPSSPEIETPTDTSTMRPSLTPFKSPNATQTTAPTKKLASTASPTFTVTPTRMLRTPVTDTPTAPGHCPPVVSGDLSIEPMHPSNDYSNIIAHYLNSGATFEELGRMLNQLQFSDAGILWRASANLVVADVTGDTTPDVVFSMLFFAPDQPVFGMGYVFYCSDERYKGGAVIDMMFGASFADPNLNETIGLRYLPDANMNGIPEILFSFIGVDDGIVSIESGQDYARWFRVLEWNGTDFIDLISDHAYGRNALVVVNGDGSFKDTDGDGYTELILQGGALSESGHGHRFFRAMTTSWEWDGYEFALQCVTASSPAYRFQAVEDGDAGMICHDYPKALGSYQRAIFDESLMSWSEEFQWLLPGEPIAGPTPIPDPDEWPLLSAYSRYRIMLIHLVNGNMWAASVVYDTLLSKFPEGTIGHQYTQLATTVWEEYTETEDLSAACQKAIQQASSQEDLAPLSKRYTYFSVLYSKPEYICPFNLLIERE